MKEIIAKIRIGKKRFELLVDLESALKLKKGEDVEISNVIADSTVYSDIKKGLRVSEDDLKEAFGTTDINTIAKKIVKNGEIEIPLEYRKKEQEDKIKQIIDFLSKNAVDPKTNNPHTPERIEAAIKEAGVNITNKPIEEQIGKVIEELRKKISIKLKIKKIRLKVPSAYVGKVYGIVANFKESETWENDGSLNCVVNIPTGLQSEFYDKLNSITHGSAITEDLGEG